MKHQHITVFIGLILLAIAMRFITFFPLTIDFDESTYLVMADHMLNGGVLYKDVVDIKPPGIFLIFSILQLVFGKSIFLVRLVTAMVVGTGAYAIYKARMNWGHPMRSAALSGIVYVLMFNFYFGFSANTEVFFVFFTSLSALALSKTSDKRWNYLFVGLLLGLGFMIKLHVAFDALAFGLFILIAGINTKETGNTIVNCVLLTAGFLIPYASAHLIYWLLGHYEYYHFITYEAPFNYSVERDVGVLAKYFKDGLITYLPFIILAIVGFLATRKKQLNNVHWLFLLMFALEWLAILATGKPHPHYWLQLTLPVAALSGGFLENEKVNSFFSKRLVKIACIVIAAGYLTFLFNYYNKRYLKRSYHSVNIYEYLKPLVKDEDRIYTGDGPQILYWLMDKRSPTPHIHQNHLTYPDKIATYNVDVRKEMDRIFSTEPTYVILSQNYPHDFVLERMKRDYETINTIDGFNIYQKLN